jgi:ectoine hydroxylase-related dioxygenase (phytanoyl-CoA dioxygenase family)
MEQQLPQKIQEELSQPFPIEERQIQQYQQHRYIKLKQVFSAECIQYFNTIISEKVAALNTVHTQIEERGTYGKAFLQLFNLWREDERIKAFVLSKRLGNIASALLKTQGVRIYHDQALFKEPGGGITPWHADQYYWPLESDKTVTAWIPLQFTPLEMGPLEFSAGSHKIVAGRELEISDESEQKIGERLRVTDFPHIREPFDLGEVSFHSGWVFHRAGANSTNTMRKVMTVIFMDSQMKLKQPENDAQVNDWNTWCPGVEIGSVIDSALNPIV